MWGLQANSIDITQTTAEMHVPVSHLTPAKTALPESQGWGPVICSKQISLRSNNYRIHLQIAVVPVHTVLFAHLTS